MVDSKRRRQEHTMTIELSHDHVAIRAVDYAGTLAWYQDKLDFTVDQEWPFGDMQLAYLSNGTAKIEILGGSTAERHATIDSLEDSLGVEEYHHFCLNVADVDGRSPSFVPAASRSSATPSTSWRSTAAWASSRTTTTMSMQDATPCAYGRGSEKQHGSDLQEL
jgi:hypothetical protein